MHFDSYCKYASKLYQQVYCEEEEEDQTSDEICDEHCHQKEPAYSLPSSGGLGPTAFTLATVIIGALMVLIIFCIGLMLYELFKLRKNRTGNTQQVESSNVARQMQIHRHGRRTIQDGPLPYQSDIYPPNYVDLCLDDLDLPNYDQATTSEEQALNLNLPPNYTDSILTGNSSNPIGEQVVDLPPPSFASIFTETEINSELPQKEEGNSSNPDYLVNLTPPIETTSVLTETEINCDMRQNEENSSNHECEQVVNLTPSYTASILPETESNSDMRQNEENSSNPTDELVIDLNLPPSDTNTSILTESISRTSLLPIFDGSILTETEIDSGVQQNGENSSNSKDELVINLNLPPSDTVASISTSSLNLLPTFSGSILTSASNLQAEINSEAEQKEENSSNPKTKTRQIPRTKK